MRPSSSATLHTRRPRGDAIWRGSIVDVKRYRSCPCASFAPQLQEEVPSAQASPSNPHPVVREETCGRAGPGETRQVPTRTYEGGQTTAGAPTAAPTDLVHQAEAPHASLQVPEPTGLHASTSATIPRSFRGVPGGRRTARPALRGP